MHIYYKTREYQQLCISLPGDKKFIHHKSVLYSKYQEKGNDGNLVEEHKWWIGSYIDVFGDFTKDIYQYWNIVNYLITSNNWTLEEVNIFSKSLNTRNKVR